MFGREQSGIAEVLHGSRRDCLRTAGWLLAGGVLGGVSDIRAASGCQIHIVVKGDTLSEIAAQHGLTVKRLKQINGLTGDLILIGQRLKLGGANEFLRPELVRVRGLKPSMWRHIIGHHSAIRYGNATIYDQNHRRRGMENGLAYHFVIGNGVDSGDGEIEVGPRWKRQFEGGHVKSRAYNLNSIGICVVGDFDKTHPTRKQIAAFTELVDYLQNDLLGGRPEFLVHRELEQTACPGRYFPVKDLHRQFG